MNRLIERLTLSPDLTRALRASTAFTVALLICFQLGHPLAAQFVSTTALNLSLVQLRGPYDLRSIILGSMITVVTSSALLGSIAAANPIAAAMSIGVLAVLSGVWRQLSPDYGPQVAVGSALLFLLALEGPAHGATPQQIVGWTLPGGAVAAILHLGLWLFRPQHALRHTIAEAWISASDLFQAMGNRLQSATPVESLIQQQRNLRETLDRTSSSLATASSRANANLVRRLDRMRHEAAHSSMQILAFFTACEPLLRRPAFAHLAPALDSLLCELVNMARSVAITLVTHRPDKLELTRARIDICDRLVQVLDEQLASHRSTETIVAQTRAILHAIRNEFVSINAGLTDTVEHSRTPAFSPPILPSLTEKSVRSLTGGIHVSGWKFDPALLRYSLRIAVISMLAVGIYTGFNIPRGNWIALAIIVVLQPDYGSTRQRAAQRVLGTVAGALLGSLLLFSPMPQWLLLGLATGMAFGFAYYLKRSYRIAVFFVTLMLVLITESQMPVYVDFTITRLLSNILGAGAAFIAALYLWPDWEREKLPTLLAKAIRRNIEYFDSTIKHLKTGAAFDGQIIQAKQEAERAGYIAAASLQRMQSEPVKQRERAEQIAALVASNQRVTSAITVLTTHIGEPPSTLDIANLSAVGTIIHDTLAGLESTAGAASGDERPTEQPPASEQNATPAAPLGTTAHLVAWALEKIAAEVQAMAIASNI